MKINFFKKIWYSIAKVGKYKDMKEEGLFSSIRYIIGIFALSAIMLAIVATIIQSNLINRIIDYMDQKLPEMTFKENKLSMEGEEDIILNDTIFKSAFNNIVIINPMLEEQEAINQYYNLAEEKYNAVVFLSDKYIVITTKYSPASDVGDGIEIHHYTDESSKYISDETKEYKKSDLISYFKGNKPWVMYIGQYFIIYLVSFTIIYSLYIIFIALTMWVTIKILKIKWEFKEAIMNTIYGSTLSIFSYTIYIIIGYFANFTIPFVDVIRILLIFIYLYIILIIEKRDKSANISNNK